MVTTESTASNRTAAGSRGPVATLGSLVRNVGAQLASRAVTSAVALISIGVVAHALGPAGAGNYLLVVSFLTLLDVSDLGLSVVGVRELASDSDAASVVLGNLLMVRGALALAGMGAAVAAASLLHYPSTITDAITLGSLSYLLLALGPGGMGLTFRAHLRMEYQAVGNIAQSVTMLAGLLAGVALHLELVWLIAASVAGAGANTLITAALSQRILAPTFRFDPALCRRVLGQSLVLGASYLAWVAYNRVDMVLLSKQASEQAVGLYGMAYRFVDLSSGVGFYLVVSLYAVLSRYHAQREHHRFEALLDAGLGATTLLAAAGATVLVVFAEPLLGLLGSQAFQPAAVALQMLAFGIVLMWASNLLCHALMATGEVYAFLWIMPLGFSFNVAVNWAAIPQWGANGAAAVTAVTELLVLGCLLWQCRRNLRRLPHLTPATWLTLGVFGAGAAGVLLAPEAVWVRTAMAAAVAVTAAIAAHQTYAKYTQAQAQAEVAA